MGGPGEQLVSVCAWVGLAGVGAWVDLTAVDALVDLFQDFRKGGGDFCVHINILYIFMTSRRGVGDHDPQTPTVYPDSPLDHMVAKVESKLNSAPTLQSSVEEITAKQKGSSAKRDSREGERPIP